MNHCVVRYTEKHTNMEITITHLMLTSLLVLQGITLTRGENELQLNEKYNPLENLILQDSTQENSKQNPDQDVRVKRQFGYYPYGYPRPRPLPIIIGGIGIGIGRPSLGFGGRGFGGRGFGGRGFGGRGFGGFGGRGGFGGFGGRGGFGGFGGRGGRG